MQRQPAELREGAAAAEVVDAVERGLGGSEAHRLAAALHQAVSALLRGSECAATLPRRAQPRLEDLPEAASRATLRRASCVAAWNTRATASRAEV